MEKATLTAVSALDAKRAKKMAENARAFDKIMALKNSDPVRFELARIGAKWDALNDMYSKRGFCEEFNDLRKDLRSFLRRSALTAEQIREYCDRHPDRWFGERFEHGYNFNYEKK